MINICINGQSEQFEAPISIETLLQQKQLLKQRLAVEHNGQIVPKSAHAETLLKSGDQIEIVIAVGGG